MKGAKRILRAGLLLALLPAAGCLSQHRSAVADVDPLGWREAAEVRFPNADTLAVCDLWLVVRYDAAFAGGPVDLEVTTVAPDSLRATEPFTLRLAPSRGRKRCAGADGPFPDRPRCHNRPRRGRAGKGAPWPGTMGP